MRVSVNWSGWNLHTADSAVMRLLLATCTTVLMLSDDFLHQWHATRSYQRTYLLPDADVMSHYELGRWLLKLMQFELINPQSVPDIHYFQGEAIYQDNLYRRLIETESGVSFCREGLVSAYVANGCELALSDTINLP